MYNTYIYIYVCVYVQQRERERERERERKTLFPVTLHQRALNHQPTNLKHDPVPQVGRLPAAGRYGEQRQELHHARGLHQGVAHTQGPSSAPLAFVYG